MINVKVRDAIAEDLGSKWCTPGKHGGGVSVDDYGDCCQFTVTISDKLLKGTIVKVILKAAVLGRRFAGVEVLPSYVFLIRVYKDKVELVCTEDGVILFTRCTQLAVTSVKEVIDTISRLMTFSYLPNIWNNKEAISFCQPVCLTYRHVWWRLIRNKACMVVSDGHDLIEDIPSVFQLGSNGLKEILYKDFHLKRDDRIVVNEFARRGLLSVTAGEYRFFFACFQLTPSHATVFYAARKYAKDPKIEKEEYRVFMDFEKLKCGIPYIVDSMKMYGITDGFEDELKIGDSGNDSIVSSEVNSIEDVIVDLNQTFNDEDDEKERALTVEEIMRDEEFDNSQYAEPDESGITVTEDTTEVEFRLFEHSSIKATFMYGV